MRIAKWIPYNFDDFFSSGMEDGLSPFLTKDSMKWACNYTLVSSLLSAFFLSLSFAFSFFHRDLSYLFLTFVFFLVGTPALKASIEDLAKFDVNIDVLMTLAAFLSIIIGSGIEGALLLVLFAISHAMEDLVTHKTKAAIQSLHRLSPTMAVIVEDDGHIYQKSVKEIKTGTKLLIQAGEIIPLDGLVIEGSSFVTLVHLTGESVPISKFVGDEVQAGSLNTDGTLTIEVTKIAADSTLSKIIKLITEAQEAKPKLQQFLDRFSRIYASTIILLSAIFMVTLPYLLGIPFVGIEGSIYRALAFLIAASPCALIIATPTAYLSAISSTAKNGILLKGGITLDAFAKCTMIAFDKTGTLTTGKLRCSQIEALTPSSFSENIALQVAYSLERSSSHPIAKAIVEMGKKKNLQPLTTQEVKSVAGYGLEGVVSFEGKPHHAFIGSLEFMLSKNPLFSSTFERKEGFVATYLSIDGNMFVFHFEDDIRPFMKETITSLKKLKITPIMLTGDQKKNAEFVASSLAIDAYYFGLKPDEKLEKVAILAKSHHLAMVGDGINDAPSLARAHVGISMGEIGSSSAIEASDIVLLKDDIRLIPWLYQKSQKTLRIIQQNLTLALGVIFLATTPALLGFIPLWMAVVLHEGGTVIVGLNSLRLLNK